MLTSNTMRFGTDIFGVIDPDAEPEDTPESEGSSHSSSAPITTSFNKQAMIIFKDYLDCTNKSQVTGFDIKGSEPEGTKRRFAFKLGDKIYPLLTNGELGTAIINTANESYTETRMKTIMLRDGNTAGDLGTMTNVPGLVGKKVQPVIALEAPANATDYPTAHLKIKARASSDKLTDVKEYDPVQLATGDAVPRISQITAEYPCTGAGSVSIRVRLQNADQSWTDYMTLSSAADRDAVAAQFQVTYKVTKTDGTDSATVKQIVIEHTLGKTVVSGDNADLYSAVVDYEVPLQMCYAVVRHEHLTDSYINAYVNFMAPPAKRTLINIGTATGSLQELTLGVNGVADLNIDASSIELFADSEPIANFSYNSAVSTVSFTAPENAAIIASYDYNHQKEIWRAMTLENTELYTDGETYLSRFAYILPNIEATNKTISNVRLQLVRPSGTVTNKVLGSATGKTQLFVLEHQPKISSIKFNNASVQHSFNADSQILTVLAPRGTSLVVSYNWTGEPINIKSFAAGWSLA